MEGDFRVKSVPVESWKRETSEHLFEGPLENMFHVRPLVTLIKGVLNIVHLRGAVVAI